MCVYVCLCEGGRGSPGKKDSRESFREALVHLMLQSAAPPTAESKDMDVELRKALSLVRHDALWGYIWDSSRPVFGVFVVF